MIEINLVSEELKQLRAQRIREKRFPVNLILLSVSAFLFCLLLIISSVSIARVASLRVLEARLKGLAPEQQKIMTLITAVDELKKKNTFFSHISPEGFLWSELLNKLSDGLVPGIWFRKLMLSEQRMAGSTSARPGDALPPRMLRIMATAVAVTGDEMSLINECIRRYKNDSVLVARFKNIEVESVMRRQIGGVDIMDFTLVFLFNEAVVW